MYGQISYCTTLVGMDLNTAFYKMTFGLHIANVLTCISLK